LDAFIVNTEIKISWLEKESIRMGVKYTRESIPIVVEWEVIDSGFQ
jgi:hypothetical protein